MTDRYLEYFSRKAGEAKAYDKDKLDASTARSLNAPEARRERAGAGRRGQARGARELSPPSSTPCTAKASTARRALNKDGKKTDCKNLDELGETIATSRNYEELTDAWAGWHSIAKPMRPKYQRFVELANEGAKELGYDDLGVLWRSRYDMPAKDFEKEAARLYGQVEPLYKGLHCYARKRLQQRYGKDKVPDGKPIPAHLLGNMWAQQWNRVYDDLLKPYPAASIESADRLLQAGQVGRGQDDEVGRELLHLDRLPGAAADFLGALHAHAPARPRSGVPRQRLGHGRQGRRAHQDVHEAHRGRPVHGLPRARPRLLLHLVQGPADPVPGRRARRLPRSHRRRDQSVGDAGLSTQDRPGRRRDSVEGSRHQPADEDGARQDRVPAVRQAHR